MLILIPIIVIILIIVVIDRVYFSDVKPNDTRQKEIQKQYEEDNKTKNYLDKYIKK
ncbi:MAG: hypothetical protein PHN38_09515 [Sulfurospirillaceae bacterium]|nr:hypothetical protein [Sulfurospirillaceae bacterium]